MYVIAAKMDGAEKFYKKMLPTAEQGEDGAQETLEDTTWLMGKCTCFVSELLFYHVHACRRVE